MRVSSSIVSLLLAVLTARADRTVLVSFIPPAGQGRACIERYVIHADGSWTADGIWRVKPTTCLAAIGDGWIYTAGGKCIGRFRSDGTPDDGAFCSTERPFWSFVGAPDNRSFLCSQFVSDLNRLGTLERRMISDPRAGEVLLGGDPTSEIRLEAARQVAFGQDGFLYVGCRGGTSSSSRSGVIALDVSGEKVREVAFYAMPGAMGGFAFDSVGRHLAVHGNGRGRVYEIGDTCSFGEIESGLANSFCAMRIGGEWYCGDWSDGTVRRYASDGRFVTVAKLRCGLSAMLCLDDVGRPIRRSYEGAGVDKPLCGPYERLKYNSTGTCDLKVGLWAFPLPMDFNGDGIDDILVQCPDTPWRGTFFFAGTKSGIYKAPVRIDSQRFWNVASSIVDGEPVVMTPEETYWNFRRNGFCRNEYCNQDLSRSFGCREGMWRFADLDGDGFSDRVCFTGGTAHWEKCLTRNGPNAVYAAPVKAVDECCRPVDGLSPICDLVDLDGDGDFDILSPYKRDGFQWRENVGSRTDPRFARARVLKDTSGEDLAVFLCMNVPCGWDLDHDGRTDILSGDEDGRVLFFRNSGKRDAAGSPAFEPYQSLRQERSDLAVGVLVAPSACDWDGDGDYDFICGDSSGSISFVENLSGPGEERPSWAEPRRLSCDGAGGVPAEHAQNSPIRLLAGLTGSIQGPWEAKWGYTSPTVVDWDGDGLLDIVVNSVWGYVYWHRNVGSRTKPRLGAASPIKVEWDGLQPELAWGINKPKGKELMTQWRTTPVAGDWDGDGLPDLIMLDTEGYLSFFRRVEREGVRSLLSPERVFINDETGRAIRLNDGDAGRSGRRKICVTDWDGDGKKDFFVSSSLYHQDERGVSVDWWQQTRMAEGKWYFANRGRLSPSRLQGHSCAPCIVDFNGDGVPDIVIGAEDGYFYYLRNPRTK